MFLHVVSDIKKEIMNIKESAGTLKYCLKQKLVLKVVNAKALSNSIKFSKKTALIKIYVNTSIKNGDVT